MYYEERNSIGQEVESLLAELENFADDEMEKYNRWPTEMSADFNNTFDALLAPDHFNVPLEIFRSMLETLKREISQLDRPY